MTNLPGIFGPADANAARSSHFIGSMPVLVLFPHNRCNCRCVMCDIWRIRQVREITPKDLEPHLASLRALRVRWVVFSGGEPLLHSDLPTLSDLFRAAGIRVTLLTAGLLLERHASAIAGAIDDLIVSLDGPPAIHNEIRCVSEAFDRMARGIGALRKLRPGVMVRGRCTVQKLNFSCLRDTVRASKQLELNSISFLAADLTSEAFNRPGSWPEQRQDSVALDEEDVKQLELEIKALVSEHSADIASGYIAESAEKLRRIAYHFRVHLGQVPATSPSCNAPWVSAVVEADGTVRPCFFHPPLGNIHKASLFAIVNSETAIEFRRRLDISSHPICQRCVCSLRIPLEAHDDNHFTPVEGPGDLQTSTSPESRLSK